jgi:hypothetical protein
MRKGCLMRLTRYRAYLVVGGVMAAAPAMAAVTDVRVRPLPNDRAGVVVDWRARSGTAVVALRSGRLLAVHSLRRVATGSRVRVDGIKWGTPAQGIKWTAPPRGIKWGIKVGRNGTYVSNLLRTGRSPGTPVRGVVVRRFRNAVAIGTRGGIVVVRMAVWLPSGTKRTNARELPAVGDTITTNVRFGGKGRLLGDGVRFVESGPSSLIPVAGRVSRVMTAERRVQVSSVSDPAYKVVTTLGVPTTIDIAKITVGQEVAAAASLTATGALRVEEISRNETFAAANDPASTQVAPPPADTATLDLVSRAIDRWTAGRLAGGIPDGGVYESGLGRLERALAAAKDGNRPVARAEVDAFIDEVVRAIPQQVTPGVAAEVLALAGAASDRLSRA